MQMLQVINFEEFTFRSLLVVYSSAVFWVGNIMTSVKWDGDEEMVVLSDPSLGRCGNVNACVQGVETSEICWLQQFKDK